MARNNPRTSPEVSRGGGRTNKGQPELGIPISEEDREIKKLAFGEVYSPAEESLRNDLNEAYLNTGRRPQNMLQGVALEERFSEYPKLQKLITLHSDLVADHAHPPTYLEADLRSFELPSLLPVKYDCILIDPPLEEYTKSHPTHAPSKPWTWDEIAELPIPQIANNPGLIWLWVGSGKADEAGVSGLDKGREILAKWGYRRCEDIVWLKTNAKRPGLENEAETKTILTHTKEHCLMGIRGTVRRSTDSHFVHCNVDTDVIVWEGDEQDPLHKPPELYNLIESFCLGTRRLELFGSSKNARAGWLTVGMEVEPPLPLKEYGPEEYPPQSYVKGVYDTYFSYEIPNLVPSPAEIEALRPRSPGGPNKQTSLNIPGLKSNPQGIGRHTNRSATPSASQQLELQQMVQQQQRQVPSHQKPAFSTLPPPPPQQQQPQHSQPHKQPPHFNEQQQQQLAQQQHMMAQAAMMGQGMNGGGGMMMDPSAMMMMQAMMAGAHGPHGGSMPQPAMHFPNGSMSPVSQHQQQQQQGFHSGMGMMPSMMGMPGAGFPGHQQYPPMGDGLMNPQQQQQQQQMMAMMQQQQQQQPPNQHYQQHQNFPNSGGMNMNFQGNGGGYGQFY